jgi:protein import protein ZIM17
MPPASTPFLAFRAISRYAPVAPQRSRCLRSLQSHKLYSRIQPFPSSFRRFNSTTSESAKTVSSESQATASQRPLTDRKSSPSSESEQPRPDRPEYQITFTCTPCGTRSSHKISKQGYHFGSTLITCPDCRNRHIISDHLNIFGDKSMTIEDLMREKGQLVKKGTLSEDGDVEFWEDGSTSKHVKQGKGEDAEEQRNLS